MNSAIGIRVAAAPRAVFDLARDVSRWPALLPHYRRVTVHGERAGRIVAQMVAIRPLAGPISIPVTWRAEAWSDDTDPNDLLLRFRHIRGVTRGMDVTWHIRSLGHAPAGADTGAGAGASDVVIEHAFERRLPLVGPRLFPWIVDRLFTRPIASRTLARFKSLAEEAVA